MSVEHFDGNGLADQPSIVYGFTETAATDGPPDSARSLLSDTNIDYSDDVEIRELSRFGYGELRPPSWRCDRTRSD